MSKVVILCAINNEPGLLELFENLSGICFFESQCMSACT